MAYFTIDERNLESNREYPTPHLNGPNPIIPPYWRELLLQRFPNPIYYTLGRPAERYPVPVQAVSKVSSPPSCARFRAVPAFLLLYPLSPVKHTRH